MSCKIKSKLIDDLINKNIINDNHEIINFEEFDKLNNFFVEVAKSKYGFDTYGKLFFDIEAVESEFTYKEVIIPNDELLELYNDIFEDIKEEYPSLDIDKTLQSKVNYTLKAVDILQSDKAKQIFEKGKKNNWDLNKILSELQIPKEQGNIIKEYAVNRVNSIFNKLEKACN